MDFPDRGIFNSGPSVADKYCGYVALKSEKAVGCIVWEKLQDSSLHLLALGRDGKEKTKFSVLKFQEF